MVPIHLLNNRCQVFTETELKRRIIGESNAEWVSVAEDASETGLSSNPHGVATLAFGSVDN